MNASLVAALLTGLALGVRLLLAPLARVPVLPPGGSTTAAAAPTTATLSGSVVPAVVANDPFRVMRRPSPVAYDPMWVPQPTVPRAPKPAPVLVGLVWDRRGDPTALVDGLPGVEGPRPVRPGDRVAGLRVKAITSDRVVIAGPDTTWTLTVREPWRQ